MPRVSIIGIGSPCGDDRAGWRVAELLAGSERVAANSEQVTVTACRSPGGELAALLGGADIAIVVDAVMNAGAAGTVYRLSGLQLLELSEDCLSSHGMRLQAMFELISTLGDLPKVVVVYGIEAESVKTVTVMSGNVLQAIFRVRDEIERDIAYYCRRWLP